MTAIIGILNKTAVVLAGDSAATVDAGYASKVYNTANKIFNLTPNNPVGISIYSSAEVMGIPWETVVKMYRRQFDKPHLPLLQDYVDDFFAYLKKLLAKSVEPSEQEDYVGALAHHLAQLISGGWQERMSTTAASPTTALTRTVQDVVLQSVQSELTSQINQAPALPSFAGYTLQDFKQAYGAVVEQRVREVLENIQSQPGFVLTAVQADDLVTLAHALVGKQFFQIHQLNWTGVVFAGFGEDELFPQLVNYGIGGYFNNELRYAVLRTEKITKQKAAAIAPFAQTDSIWGFLSGIDPSMQMRITDMMRLTLDRFSQQVMATFANNVGQPVAGPGSALTLQPQHAHMVQMMAAASAQLVANLEGEIMQMRQDEYLAPVLNTIPTLSKEDLAEMAEALISLTYLQRRVRFAEESVGGPVDVVVITKGEGFVWLKRKHYFRPELNLNYLGSVIQAQARNQQHVQTQPSTGTSLGQQPTGVPIQTGAAAPGGNATNGQHHP